MKKAFSALLCLALLTCALAGCKKTEEEPETVNPNVVLADLMGVGNEQMRSVLGEPSAREAVDGQDGFEYSDYASWIGFNLHFENSERIPSSYYISTILFGPKAPEIMLGIKPGMSYNQVKSIEQFSGIDDLGESKTDTDGFVFNSADVQATVDYNGKKISVVLTFDTQTMLLKGGNMRLVTAEDESEDASVAEELST